MRYVLPQEVRAQERHHREDTGKSEIGGSTGREGGQEEGTGIGETNTLNWGDGNIDVDPRFIDPDDGNYNLYASSRLINAGDPNIIDADNSRSDIGAYPYLTISGPNTWEGPVWYVDPNGSDINGVGTSAGIPFASVQAGLNLARDGDTVMVASGEYFENVIWPDATYKTGVQLIGEDSETTIINGGEIDRVLQIINVDESSSIRGFTITDGFFDETVGSNGAGGSGAGLWILNSSLLLEDLRVLNNHTDNLGAGIFIADGGTPYFKNILVSENSGIWGIIHVYGFESGWNESEHPVFENVTISGNAGDGIGAWYSGQASLINCIIYDNDGYIYSSTPIVTYSLIEGGYSGEGNIDFDPLFTNPENSDFNGKLNSGIFIVFKNTAFIGFSGFQFLLS